MYQKDFDGWNSEKKQLNSISKNVFPIHHREIWYVKLGINIGYEEDGKKEFRRPVIVMKKIGNLYFGLPLTTKSKGNKRYHDITSIDFNKTSAVILSQGRTLDHSRFISMIGKISPEEFIIIKQKIAKMYGY